MGRSLACVGLVVLLLLPGGCGGGGGGGGGGGAIERVAVAATKGGKSTFTFHLPPVHVPPPAPPAIESTAAALRDASTVSAMQSALRDMASTGDPVDKAITNAFCAGVNWLKDQPDNVRGANWQDFLVGQVKAQLPSVPQPKLIAKVNGLLNTFDLAQINPRLAYTYYRACVAGG